MGMELKYNCVKDSVIQIANNWTITNLSRNIGGTVKCTYQILWPLCLDDKHTTHRILIDDLNFESQHVHVDIWKKIYLQETMHLKITMHGIHLSVNDTSRFDARENLDTMLTTKIQLAENHPQKWQTF